MNAQTIFQFDNERVKIDEFKYVYEKNNGKGSDLYSKASVEEYLDLYINFKLKVAEAQSLGMDTTAAFKKELAGYRQQLSQSYMKDTRVSKKLLEEAYDRSQKDILVSHLLIKVSENATPKDKKVAKGKIENIRKQLAAGLDFNEAARTYSEDPSAKDNAGNLGYISVFRTVYDFETAAYNTAPGELSQPVLTKFGYHLLKVDGERPARGEVRVAHLFLKTPKFADEDQLATIESKIVDFQKQLNQGADWNALVEKYSEDKTTKKSGGDLQWFGTGKMVDNFEDTAFALENTGDISQAIQTKFGWHILKLLDKRPLGTFDEMSGVLKSKVEKDSRSEVAKRTFFQNLKKEYNYKEFPIHIQTFFSEVDSSFMKGRWKGDKIFGVKTPLFSIQNDEYNIEDFIPFLEKNQRKYRSKDKLLNLKRLLDRFVEQELIKVEDSMLEVKYPDFKALMREYYGGMLLFELTNEMVWDKAVKDTIGLEKFYDRNKENYKWDERIEASTYEIKNAKTASKFSQLKSKGKLSTEAIIAKLNKVPGSIVSKGSKIYEKGDDEYIDSIDWVAGKVKSYPMEEGSTKIVTVNKIIPKTVKALEDAKGYVISDYQAELEEEWIAKLKEKYPVKVNQKVVNSLIRK